MDRSREGRKVPMAAPVGVSRRRHRGGGLRDSPDEDGPVELQETARLRDRKKERERERERDRERSSRNKRRRGDRLMHASNREEGPVDSTDESVNDEDEEDYEEDGGGGGSSRMPPPNPASTSSPSLSNHHRKSFPQPNASTKMFRPASPWKPADEMIGVPIPRKARSASTKRAHDCWVSGSGGLIGGDQLHRQASTSPARSSLVSATASPLRMSPPSSNLSVQKKMKLIGSNKHRSTLKASTSKTASSNQDEIEFEIAEVLYGMMTQPPDATKPEGDANEALNKSASDSKSRVSSPASAAAQHQSSTVPPLNSASSAMVVTVPKRKRPRQVNYGDENVGLSSRENIIRKSDVDPAVKAEPSSTGLERNFKQVLANEGVSPDLEQSRDESATKPSAVLTLHVKTTSPESVNLRAVPTVAGLKDVDTISIKRDSPVSRIDENGEENSRPSAPGLGIQLEEKFQIDLMAPPPASRLSPERDGNIHYVSSEPNKSIYDLEEPKPVVKDAAADESRILADPDHKRFQRGSELHKASLSKERSVNLQLTTEKNDGESGMAVAGSVKHEMPTQHQQAQPQLPRIPTGDEATRDKTVSAASSLPSAMSVAGWQGGLSPLGYMTPLQGVVSMEGSALSSTPLQPPHVLLNQPRPKRCATHCYIARSISCHQQFTRMNPFWPAAAGSAAAIYGANPCNLNVVPPVELHCSTGVRGVTPVPDKSQGVFPVSNTGKDKPSQAPNISDAAQRKQILLQQSVPPGVPGNLLRGPAFIFPLSQQQAAAAASALTTTMKNPPVAGASPTGNLNSGPGSAASAAPAAMSFNYPNMATNETQYLAILQNNPYQLPFPTHAGTPPVYRGAHPQAMPFFNGTFYSPQMLHPSQLQQQPQQSAHGHQVPPGQNMGISSGSSSSQKHLQIHSQKSQGNGSSAGTANMKQQSYPSPKSRPSHLLLKQHNQHLTETGSEDSPSTADSWGSRSNFGMYTEGLNLPIHAQNFALMSGGGTATPNGVSNGNHLKNGNHTEKKPHQLQQGLKVGADLLPSHQGFAVSFASLNGDGGPPALDIASMGQSHAVLQNLPDAARHHSYQIMVAQQAQKKNLRSADEVKKASGGDVSNVEDERQSMVGKGVLSNVGLSIAFSRSDMVDSSSPGNKVVDSSSRNLKGGSGPGRTQGHLLSPSLANTQQQMQHHQQQQQQHKAQLMQLHKQPQQYMASATRGKTPSLSNGNVYSDQLPTNAAMAAKLTNSLTTFQQNHAPMSGGGNSPTQSQQWKNSARASISQAPSPALAPTNLASVKNLYQQQSHMQISFGGSNPKSLSSAQGQHPPAGHQNPSPIVAGSAAASLNYKSSGSSRTTTAAGIPSKAPATISPSASLQVKNSSMPSRSSSPVGARNVPSALGNSNMGMPQGNPGSKPQMFQQQQQQQMKQQLSKQAMQQAQFPSYLQTNQGPNPSGSTTSAAAANSGYLQRRRPDSQQSQQQSQSPSGASSTGMLSMCSPSIAATTDPSKAAADAAAAGSNVKAPSK